MSLKQTGFQAVITAGSLAAKRDKLRIKMKMKMEIRTNIRMTVIVMMAIRGIKV